MVFMSTLVRRSLPLLLFFAAPLYAAETPDPALAYRTGKPDARVREVPAAVQQGVFSDPSRYLGPLVESLVKGVADPMLRVKILHDWIAENIAYDADSFFAGARVDTAWAATLRQRKSVCQGYAALLTEMCRLAGIRCETIGGYGRGYAFLNARSENPGEGNHAWNAVQLGGKWRLVDVTWDAGHVEGRVYHKQYSTAYLFADPQQFLYTHLPSQPAWQLVEKPLSAAQFAELPYLRGEFFEHGLRLSTPLGRVTQAKETIQFSLHVPDTTDIAATLKSAAGSQPPRSTLVCREERSCRVMAAFPQPGRWTLNLHAKPRSDPGVLHLVATLDFDVTAGTPYTFPTTYSAYDDLDGCLVAPLFEPLRASSTQSFRIRLGRPTAVFLVLGKSPWKKMTAVSGTRSTYEINAVVPSGPTRSGRPGQAGQVHDPRRVRLATLTRTCRNWTSTITNCRGP
jgi:hypothetical protein